MVCDDWQSQWKSIFGISAWELHNCIFYSFLRALFWECFVRSPFTTARDKAYNNKSWWDMVNVSLCVEELQCSAAKIFPSVSIRVSPRLLLIGSIWLWHRARSNFCLPESSAFPQRDSNTITKKVTANSAPLLRYLQAESAKAVKLSSRQNEKSKQWS